MKHCGWQGVEGVVIHVASHVIQHQPPFFGDLQPAATGPLANVIETPWTQQLVNPFTQTTKETQGKWDDRAKVKLQLEQDMGTSTSKRNLSIETNPGNFCRLEAAFLSD